MEDVQEQPHGPAFESGSAVPQKRPRGPSTSALATAGERPGKIYMVDDGGSSGDDNDQLLHLDFSKVDLASLGGAFACFQCGAWLWSEHSLNLHQLERHDPIELVKRDRGEKTFRCLERDCDKACLTWKRRRLHCLDKHRYPQNFDFFLVNDGVKGKKSFLQSDWVRKYRTGQLNDKKAASGQGQEQQPEPVPQASIPRGQRPGRSAGAGYSSQRPSHPPKHRLSERGPQVRTSKPDPLDSLTVDFNAALRFPPRSVAQKRTVG